MRAASRWWAAGAVLLAFAALMLLRPLPAQAGQVLAYVVQSVTAALAGVALVRGATGPLRRARLLLAGALAAGALAGVLATVVQLATGSPPPVPGAVDLVHLSFLPLAVAGLLSFPTQDAEAGSAARCLVDGLLASLALWFLAYALLLEPAVLGEGQGEELDAALTALVYPTADLFVIGTLVGVLPRVAPAVVRQLLLLGGGFAVYAASDIAYSVVRVGGGYRADSGVSVLAEAGLLLLLLGAAGRVQEPAQPVGLPLRHLGLVVQLPVVAVLVLVAVQGLRGEPLDGVLLACALGMAAVLMVRQRIGTRDRRALLRTLASREELFRALVNGGSDLITLTDGVGLVLWSSPAVARTVGRAAVMGESLLDSVHPDDRDRLTTAALTARDDPEGLAETLCRLESSTGWRWMQVRFQDRLDDPSVRGLICNARDVHDSHVLQQQLSHAASHDVLTGLGNLARARELLDRSAGRPGVAGVLLIDLDGFKAVNDTFGHDHGDALLVEVARRLVSCLRSGDEVVRLGGDEFLLLVGDADDVEALARRVLALVREPVDVLGSALTTSASVGTALAGDADGPDDLLRNADLAMYASKDAGRDRTTAYEPGMHRRAARRMQLSRGLREALDADLLVLHYQPVVRLSDGVVVGAEALLRWHDARLGPVDPGEFIGVAEESGLIAEVDRWVLDRACRDVAAWRSAGLTVPRISVNVSRRLITAELPELVDGALSRHGLPGSCLGLEVTESAVVADLAVASGALAQLRTRGITVALDDFGTGQSSLAQLVRLPVDSVKIDMAFTRGALQDLHARRLLMAVLRVCQSLSLPAVAEGIEQAEVAVLLAEAGCEQGQGWHFGRPRPAAEFAAALLPQQTRPAAGTPVA